MQQTISLNNVINNRKTTMTTPSLNGLGSKFLNRMFRKIDGIVIDLTTGKQGIQDTNGIYSFEAVAAVPASGSGANKVDATPATGVVTVNPFESFGITIPAFATQIPFEKIKPGDIVVGDKAVLGWVISKTDSSLKLLDKTGMTKNYTPPKVAVIGGAGNDGVLVVQNLIDTAGGETGFGALQGSLLPLLMLGGGDLDLENILPLMLLTQTQTPGAAGGTALQSMLPMLLLSGKGGLGGGGGLADKMLPLMMIGGLGGNGGGINPLMLAMLSEGGIGGGVKTTHASGDAPALKQISKSNSYTAVQ